MNDDEQATPNVPAMVDKHVRRFLYDRGDTSALAPHEVEGYTAELRYSLSILDAAGDAVSPEVHAVREQVRLRLGDEQP